MIATIADAMISVLLSPVLARPPLVDDAPYTNVLLFEVVVLSPSTKL